MIPWVHLDTAAVPGGGTLKLMQRGAEFAIFAGNVPLMNSRMSSSEIVLAEIACERLKDKRNARLLIGGYGMGFTLRAALEVLGPKAELVVAELVPEVIEWARGPMAHIAAGCLDDPRVRLLMGDVGSEIDGAHGDYDAILLDVDNGPDGVVRDGNGALSTSSGLRSARRALKPGGVLAVWSAGTDPAFTRRLEKNGFAVDQIRVPARSNGKGPKHTIWFATPN